MRGERFQQQMRVGRARPPVSAAIGGGVRAEVAPAAVERGPPAPALRPAPARGTWTTSNRAGASRSRRWTRAVKRDARTKRDGLAASRATSSRCTCRRPGKFSNVRMSRTSSSRNVAGAPSGVDRAVEERHQRVEGRARRCRRRRAAGSRPDAAGWRRRTAARQRSGVVAAAPKSRYWLRLVAERPAAAGAAGTCGPLPQPPSTTGMRPASSDASTRRSSAGRSTIIGPAPIRTRAWGCGCRGAPPRRSLPDSPRRRAA